MSDTHNNHPAPIEAAGASAAPAALNRKRNLAIITGGVIVTLCIIGYFIYSETPQHTPINIASPYQYLPNNTTTVLYVNGKELFKGGVEQYKTTMDSKEGAAQTGGAAPTGAVAAPADNPDALFAQAGAQAATGLTLLDQIKGLRDVEHILVTASRGSVVPTLVVAPFRDPRTLMNNLKSLPGFSSSRLIVDDESGWPVLQLKLAWAKLLYLSAAEDQYLFAGDGTYFLKTLRGFQRPVKAASFQGGPIEPLLGDIRPGTVLSVVQVISYADDLEGQFNALAAAGDPSSIALLRSIGEVGASLRHMQAVRMDVWRRAGDGAMTIEVSLLFSRAEFGEAFQRNVDQARNTLTVVAGIFLPRDVGAAFTELAAGLATPRQTERVVTLTIADSPKKIEAFLSATGAWLEGQMNIAALINRPASM